MSITLLLFFAEITVLSGQGEILYHNILLDSATLPWYSSNGIYWLLGLLLLGGFFFAYLRQTRNTIPQKQLLKDKEEALRNLKAAQLEQEKLQQQYRLLEGTLEGVKKQLRSKTIALAKKTKKSDEKGRMLRVLKEEVDEITKHNDSVKFMWREVSRILGQYQEAEENNFSVLIEELHQDFLTRLSKDYPDLTTYDLRLCVYLKSGLSTREMAEMMSVLPSSVNVSRSRLRKKLNLSPKEDLYKFLKKLA
ncbi:MAG: helix-turn-helix transcriptional regulator [Lewinella sp.]